MPTPDLPEPAYADLDSMLTRKFGKEVANYFAGRDPSLLRGLRQMQGHQLTQCPGSPLNRVSFLRSDHLFLTSALKHPTSSFLLFNELKPLCHNASKLAFAKFQDIKGYIGDIPFSISEDQMIEEYNSTTIVPLMVFLGLDEGEKDGLLWKDTYRGAPMWAVDVSEKGSIAENAKALTKELESRGLMFHDGRMILSLPAQEGLTFERVTNVFYTDFCKAAIYAQARSMLDWNARNPFCGGCGQPTISVNGGGKRACPPKDFGAVKGVVGSTTGATPADPIERPPCSTRGRVSNLSFPRTDPTVIMAVVSHDGQKMLLGRQKRFPPCWYSALAGFCEPAESIEEAVRREVYEESGVKMSRVVIHSSQPWPYPA